MGVPGVVFEKRHDKSFSKIQFDFNYFRLIDASNNLSDDDHIKIQDDTSNDRHLLFIAKGSGSILLEDVIRGYHEERKLEAGYKVIIPKYIAYTITLFTGAKVFKFGEKKESGFANIYETNVDYSPKLN
ncbi:MAG TPA: hypothetical protein VEC16_03580 [Alphaproteobacteria bacterium]|nr:hypothetical protein [Alphaproteobacteria bacterium]